MKKPKTELIQGDSLADVHVKLDFFFRSWECKEIVEVFINKLPEGQFYKYEALIIYTEDLYNGPIT